MNPKALVTDVVPKGFVDEIEQLGFDTIYLENPSMATVKSLLPDLELIVINTKIILDKTSLETAKKLQFILRPGSGLDNVDIEYCNQHGIKVYNSPEANAPAVAEHSLGLLLSLTRNITKAHNEVTRLQWIRKENTGIPLSKATIGIIGYGNTGSAFSALLAPFGCTILAYDKYKAGFGNNNVSEASLEEIQKKANIISLHLPQNEETKNFVDEEFISNVSNPFYLINTARGGLIELNSLQNGLTSNKILGAGLDVLPNENLDNYTEDEREMIQKLLESQKVIITPHIAGWTTLAREDIFWIVLQKFKNR